MSKASPLEVAPPAPREQLQGWVAELATEEETFEALEKAFDYRGDITITRKDGSIVEGYVFDRQTGTVSEMTPAECAFAYRTSLFKHSDRRIVLAATFRLRRSPLSRPVRRLGREHGAA